MTPMTNLSPTDERATLTDERLKELLEACVKPLEWIDSEGRDEDGGYDVVGASSAMPLAHYWMTYADLRDPEIWLVMRDRGHIVGRYMTMTEAKAAAEADYRQRILSALDPTLLSLRQKDGENWTLEPREPSIPTGRSAE